MARFLVACAIGWPALLATSMALALDGHTLVPGLVWYAAGLVCHQAPDRSYHFDHVQWFVCARCSGLYLSAIAGAIAGFAMRRGTTRTFDLVTLAAAAIPTATTFVVEKAGIAPVGNAGRFLAALPLGAALAWLVVRTAAGNRRIE
jgi:uncharacterized membrane protein